MEPQVIASTYEVIREIGSGGGGVVYQARHNRLDKYVVLKADKGKLTKKKDVLRREVDALKNLSHTYIPQVYDFLEEDGRVYTVMDYIEGESLDKPLQRGERFTQPQVIKWSCQLLQALDYLHGRPPHGILHSDVKPANIMLTPAGDIKLIDFNIALALGEDGAIRVGHSPGYASPEHYGYDMEDKDATLSQENGVFVGDDEATVLSQKSAGGGETVLVSQKGTIPRNKLNGSPDPSYSVSSGSRSGSGYSSRKNVLLDVRSDIYSAGATIYHLLSGSRPDRDAHKVEPLSPEEISPALIAIIEKAMAPVPSQRYQTAAEMLYELEHLHSNDPRTKSLNRRIRSAMACGTAAFLLGGVLLVTGLYQTAVNARKAENDAKEEVVKATEEKEELNIEVLKKNAASSASASLAAAQQGDIPGALSMAMDSLSSWETSDGIYALANASGVYNMDGGFYAARTLPLDGKPLKMTLSPEGGRLAVLTSGTWTVFNTETGDVLCTMTADVSALSEAVFRDERTLYYAGSEGVVCYGLDEGVVRWTGRKATTIVLSADHTTLAAIYRDAQNAVIYDAESGEQLRIVDFGGKHQTVLPSDNYKDPGDNLCAISADGAFLAVSFSDGSLTMYDLRTGGAAALLDPSNYVRFEGGFGGAYFAFSAASPENNDFLYEVYRMSDGWEIHMSDTAAFHCFSDETGIFYSSGTAVLNVDLDTETTPLILQSSTDIQSFEVAENYISVLGSDGVCRLYDRGQHSIGEYRGNEKSDPMERFEYAALAGKTLALGDADLDSIRILREDSRPETVCFTYAPDTPHTEARVSQKNSTLVLFTPKQFQIYAQNGRQLVVTDFPEANQIFDTRFVRDGAGDSIEALYYDGTLRRYSAADGVLLEETKTDPPDREAAKERVTGHWRILVPRQGGVPEVYDLDSGEQLTPGYLSQVTGRLTYATQAGSFVAVEYFTEGSEKFGGLLLDEDRNLVAELPWLTDVLPDGTVYFDDRRGQIRETHIYSLPELLDLTNRDS